MKNDGTAAETFFVSHWSRIGHLQRLRDKKDLMGLNKGARIADFAKPSDFLVSTPDTALHYAEIKSTNNPTRFPFGDIRPSQSAAALREAGHGIGAYLFYIFSYARGAWFIMPCKQYAELVASGARSVPFEELIPWQP